MNFSNLGVRADVADAEYFLNRAIKSMKEDGNLKSAMKYIRCAAMILDCIDIMIDNRSFHPEPTHYAAWRKKKKISG